jgi:transposase
MAKKGPNVRDFQKRFPTEDACLEHLMRTRFGERLTCFKCQKQATYYRVKARRSYECEHCGYQVYPTAGTPFESTRTPLRDWFYVMFLFCAARNGVAAKEVQRQLGVTYKTAWRMCFLIRKYMGYVDGDFPLGGPGKTVEIDETFIGGKGEAGKDDKAVVFGIVERNWRRSDSSCADAHQGAYHSACRDLCETGNKNLHDDGSAFKLLTEKYGYEHQAVDHSAKEYARGDVHTNTIEGFWANVKRGINGTYVWVSKKHLRTYLREFEYRHNLRQSPDLMFDCLLAAFPKVRVG